MQQVRPKESLLRFLILILTMNQIMVLSAVLRSAKICFLKEEFSCEPRLRSYNVKDLQENTNLTARNFEIKRPAYIVQQRCDSYSGCCISKDQSCAPLESDYEQIEIQVQYINGTVTNIKINVERHKNCTCRESTRKMRSHLSLPTIQFPWSPWIPLWIFSGDEMEWKCWKSKCIDQH